MTHADVTLSAGNSLDVNEVDWNAILKERRGGGSQTLRKNGAEYWDKRAPSFAEHAGKTKYPDAFIKILNPESSWTVLDMGCGAGTLALPLADMVAQITAVDHSGKMLELLRAEADRRKIGNMQTIQASWEDDWNAFGIGTYDVAIASRSLITNDARAAIGKLVRAARKRIVISTIVGDGPHDRRAYEAVGRPLARSADYIYVYNLLYQMGVHAEVSFIPEERQQVFGGMADAIDAGKWMFPEMTSAEESRLAAYIRAHLVENAGGLTLDYRLNCKWAVFHWDVEG
jgi:SAM-dependent methyltransferase